MLEIFFTIFDQVFLYLPLLLGAYLAFSLMKIPNFSIESAYVSGSIAAVLVMPLLQGAPTIFCLIVLCSASLIGGAFVGCIVSMLNNIGKIPHLLANVLTVGLCYGINLYMLGNSNVSLMKYNNPLVIDILPLHPELISIAMIAIIMLGIMILVLRSPLGMSCAIYGNNPLFFKFSQASQSYVVFCGVVISNALAGLSGYLVSQSSGFVDINAGTGIALFCLTALILGKSFSQRAPFVGLLMYCSIQQFLLKIGCNAKYFMAIQALIVVVLLAVHYRSHKQPDMHTDHLGI